MLLLLNKPYRVLCQFTGPSGRATLADYVPVPGVYAAGRLDHDSEGLILLTDDGPLQARIADPRHGLEKTYWAQVESVPTSAALGRLRRGVRLADGWTRPARVRLLGEAPPSGRAIPRSGTGRRFRGRASGQHETRTTARVEPPEVLSAAAFALWVHLTCRKL